MYFRVTLIYYKHLNFVIQSRTEQNHNTFKTSISTHDKFRDETCVFGFFSVMIATANLKYIMTSLQSLHFSMFLNDNLSVNCVHYPQT
jgi:hypothetical protein